MSDATPDIITIHNTGSHYPFFQFTLAALQAHIFGYTRSGSKGKQSAKRFRPESTQHIGRKIYSKSLHSK